MKTTWVGVLAAGAFALLPLFTFNYLPYDGVNSKFFFLTFVTVLFALGFAHALWRGKDISVRGRYFLWGLGAVLVSQYAAAILGAFPERSLWSDIFWSSGVLFLTHLAVLAAILAETLTKADWSLVRRWTVYGAGFFGVLTAIGVQGLGFDGRVGGILFADSGLTLGNETYAGAYLLLASVFGLVELLNARAGSTTKKLLIAALVSIAISPLLLNIGLLLGRVPLSLDPTLILGTARASSAAFFLLLAFTAGYLLLRKFGKGKLLKAWATVFLVSIALVVGLLFTPGSSVQNAYIEASTAARIIVWDVSWDSFLERPVLGWGPENFDLALQENFDSRLFEDQNLGEIWFERAHNVVLDTLVGSGLVGVASFSLLTILYLLTIRRAHKRGKIRETEAVTLAALVPVHLLQMQTGFDTVASYALLALALGYVLSLERELGEGKAGLPDYAKKTLAVVLALAAIVSFRVMVLDEYARQASVTETFRLRSAVEQQSAVVKSLGRVSSFESLRFSSSSFLTGAFALLAEKPGPEGTKLVLEYLTIYEHQYKEFLAVQPNHYRARMNYAYLLLVKTALGENRVEEAKELIRDSYRLSDGHPLTYVLDSVSELYSGNLKEADRLMQEAIAINPNVGFTQEAAMYLERQKAQFPNISVLKIGNL